MIFYKKLLNIFSFFLKILLLLTLFACSSNYRELLLHYNFKYFGSRYVSSSFSEVSVQQIYLSLSEYLNKRVIVRGRIKNLDNNYTYLLLETEGSVILVFLDAIDSALFSSSVGKDISILAFLRLNGSGKPYLSAQEVFYNS